MATDTVGVPATWLQWQGYQAGYWLATNHAADAVALLAQPWQSPDWRAAQLPTAQMYFWHRVGMEDGLGGAAQRAPAAPLADPGGSDLQTRAYSGGYSDALGSPQQSKLEYLAIDPVDLDGDPVAYWRFQGLLDGLSSKGARYGFGSQAAAAGGVGVTLYGAAGVRVAPPVGTRAVPAGVRVAPAYVPGAQTQPSVYVPAPVSYGGVPLPWGPPPPYPFLEVVASLPFLGKVPYDLAVGVRKLPSGNWLATLLNSAVTFEILGNAPGDQQLGFRLSGPNGALARLVAAQIAAGAIRPDPRTYGLAAWVGARISTYPNVRLLGRQTLQQLGLAD